MKRFGCLCLLHLRCPQVRRYERLSALRPARQALGSLDRLASGDAVVAFSRRAVHALRQEVEALCGRSCAVVYGALPPGPRRQQAALFNAPRNGISVLAASDAVGMGLNLKIKRVGCVGLAVREGLTWGCPAAVTPAL